MSECVSLLATQHQEIQPLPAASYHHQGASLQAKITVHVVVIRLLHHQALIPTSNISYGQHGNQDNSICEMP